MEKGPKKGRWRIVDTKKSWEKKMMEDSQRRGRLKGKEITETSEMEKRKKERAWKKTEKKEGRWELEKGRDGGRNEEEIWKGKW